MTLLTTAPQAAADYEQYAMNGSFSVVANGEWAKIDDRYQDQPTMDSTWTVTSVCSSAFTCAGKVSSSQGWTEDVYTTSGDQWYVRHAVPEWIPCPDGTTAPGLQVFTFYRSPKRACRTSRRRRGSARPDHRRVRQLRQKPFARAQHAAKDHPID